MGADPKIGLVLGGGGARGLSHAVVLEAFDELGIKPHAMAGSSIGALIGTGYAGGMSGTDVRQDALERFHDRSKALAKLWELRPNKIQDWFSAKTYSFAQFDPERILTLFSPIETLPENLEELQIPFSVVTSDYYNWHDVAYTHGPLLQLVAASIAIPGLFKPVVIGERTLVDGNVTNPLPFDRLPETCDLTIAVDVVSGPQKSVEGEDTTPTVMKSLIGSAQIMMQAIAREKLRNSGGKVDLLITPPIDTFSALDFLKANLIFRSVRDQKEDYKRQIAELIENYSS